MRHDVEIEGIHHRLRPVELADAEVIVELRGDGHRNRFLHPIPPSVEEQERYIRAYFDQPDEWYFALERCDGSGIVNGLGALYNRDLERNSIELGRVATRPGSRAGNELILLLAQAAFEAIGVDEMEWFMVDGNDPVFRLSGRAQLSETDRAPETRVISGVPVRGERHFLLRKDHPAGARIIRDLVERDST